MGKTFSLAIPDVENTANQLHSVLEAVVEQTTKIQDEIRKFADNSWEGKSQEQFIVNFEKWISDKDQTMQYLTDFKGCLSPSGLSSTSAGVDILTELRILNGQALGFDNLIGGSVVNDATNNLVYYSYDHLEVNKQVIDKLIYFYDKHIDDLSSLSGYTLSNGFSLTEANVCSKDVSDRQERLNNLKNAFNEYGIHVDNLEQNITTAMAAFPKPTAPEVSNMSPQDLSNIVFKTMSAEALGDVDPDQLTPEQRASFLNTIFYILNNDEIKMTEQQREVLLNILSTKMTEEERMAMVYSDITGEYGGDQGSPVTRFRDPNETEYQDYIRGLLPGMSDQEIEVYLSTFNSVGCGYIALTNSIFVEYANRPDEFEEVFGFPMYTYGSDGRVHLNFDYLVIDLYNNSGNIGKGTDPSERKKILENYLEDKGVNVNVTKKKTNATPENIEEALEQGQVILRQRPVKLYDMNGNIRQNSDGGHAIMVTGLTEDGNLIVSSWGEQLIVKPEDYPGFNLFNTDTWGTYLDFEVITYE